ncbi:MAG: hypothetical protein NTZ18_02570 [Candidatus Komeilibacteria bacterium]|nr:hypothetical protein [Candidatus Komeilibacteria bacterium]
MFSSKRTISIFLVLAVFVFTLANFIYLPNRVLAQGVSVDDLRSVDSSAGGIGALDIQSLKALLNAMTPPIPAPPGAGMPVTDAAMTALKYQADLKDYQAYKLQITAQIKLLEESKKSAWQKIKDYLKQHVVDIAYKNALRTFLSHLAYDTATRIAEGGVGKSPLFNIKSMGSFLNDVYQTTLVDTLDLLARDNGFFSFDICQPDINLSLAINYSLFGNFSEIKPRGAARCTFRQISERWGEWLSTNFGSSSAFGSSENFLKSFKGAFEPAQTDVGIYLTLDSSIRSKLVDEKTKQMFDNLNNQGIKPITEPISKFIKTPATVITGQVYQNLAAGPISSETVRTGDIVADALGIFTNTLAAKLIKKLLDKGLTEGQRAQSTIVYNWANQQAARTNAAQTMAELAEVSYSSGQERVLDDLTQCQNIANPGPNECVMEPKLVGAVEQGLTVREAILKGQLRGNWLLGYKPNGTLTYINGYPYRSLVIMRINRILPVGWELAAQYALAKGQHDSGYSATLQHVVDCYEDMANPTDPKKPDNCRESMDGNDSRDDAADYNPYYHLVDPNWVLKSPEVMCAKKGFGPQFISPGLRSNDYCADRKTCLTDDGSGNCVGNSGGEEYGYCLKEKATWNFPGGQSCQAQFASCETLTRTADSQQFSYLRDTLKECDINNAGCLWYATQATKALENARQVWHWQPAESSRIYLNDQAQNCNPTDGGCTKLSRMLPGTNAVFNGDFSFSEDGQMPDGWILNGNRCQASYARDAGAITVSAKDGEAGSFTCTMASAGFIPIDSRFTYALSAALMSPNSQKANVGLQFYGADKQTIGNIRYNIFNQDGDGFVTPGSSWTIYKGEVTGIPANAEYAKVLLAGPVVSANVADRGLAIFDSIQLVITKSPVVRHNVDNFSFNPTSQTDYQNDYSHNESYGREYLKASPAYLGCAGYNDIIFNADNDTAGKCLARGHYWRSDIARCVLSGDSTCQNYTAVCKDTEIGCQGYKPLSGDPEVSGITTADDVCPSACVGFSSYLESPTYFDQIENPNAQRTYQNFIPAKGLSCSAIDAGCEEFTNTTNEQKEYFSYLRQCVLPNNPGITFYYTWEGSDTSGYQLKKWSFLKSNLDGGPCTNMRLGTEECNDTAETQAICTADDAALNPDCRDFFDRTNTHFWRLQNRAITASASCSPFRRTATSQVYNADPGEGKSCSATANGCREYHGNQGNNIRNVLTDNFESQTVGAWQNSAGTTEGLAPSNEAVERGGHSLRVSVSNHILTQVVTNKIKAGKEYTLSFYAKKAVGDKTGDLGNRAQLTALDFSLNAAGLSNDWLPYTLGPIELSSINDAGAILQLTINGLDNEVFYIDNILLKETTSNFYLIKDSWLQTTPAECNSAAMLGCQQYVDRDKQNHFLKSFTGLCSSSAIGCEAYINTQNSSNYQSAKTYDTGVCNADVGTVESGDCKIRNITKCHINAGQSSCNYHVVTVPNDELVYLVNDATKQCTAAQQGCSLLGQPAFDRRVEDYNNQGYISSFANVYKINNPDLYLTQLCSESGLFCSRFSGSVSSNKAFYDPEAGSGNGVDSSQTCYYNNNDSKWYQSGTNNVSCYPDAGAEANKFLPPRSQYNYVGWVGLCSAGQSTCTEYRDPQTPVGQDVEQCDSRIAPQLRGLCVVGQNGATLSASGDYCQFTIDGVAHNVCALNGGNWCAYSSADWICEGNQAAYNGNGQLISGTGDCKVAGKKVCYIPDTGSAGQPGTCTYSLSCNSAYYLSNSFDKATACTTVDRQAGCLLFNNTANPTLDKSNAGSENGAAPSSGDAAAVYGQDGYQDANLLMQVKKDRQCGEWLECRTGFEQTGASGKSEFICLDLYRCSQAGSGDKKCSKIISTQEAAKPVYDLSADISSSEINKIANLSGFSHPGLKWNDSISAAGQVSPEQMSQVGQVLPIVNGGFETFLGSDLTKPEGWLNAWPHQDDPDANYSTGGTCTAILDADSSTSNGTTQYNVHGNVHSGHYSLRVDLADGAATGTRCVFTSRAGNAQNLYPITPADNYNLSFYLKSSNGGQKAKVGLVWYSNDYHICDNSRNWCRGAGQGVVPNQEGGATGAYLGPLLSHSSDQWEKYVLSVGPGTDRPIPADARFARIYFFNFKPDNNASSGAIWYDDFSIEPVLDTGGSQVSKECRLYPAEDAPSCSYQGNKSYEGWKGYCLESDPNNPAQCLQWYPVDSLSGDRLSVFNMQSIGYADRAPLYYCAQTNGNYNKTRYTDNAPYGGSIYLIPGNSTANGYKYQLLSQIRNTDFPQENHCTTKDIDKVISRNLWFCQRAEGDRAGHEDWEAGCALQGNSPGRGDRCRNEKANNCISPCYYAEESDEQGNNESTFYFGQRESAAVTLDEIAAIKFELNVLSGFSCDINTQDGFLKDVTDSLDDIDAKYFIFSTNYYKKFDKVFLYSSGCGEATIGFSLAFGQKPGSTVERLLRIEATFGDDGSGAGGIEASVYYYLKDRCSLIAQTVSTVGGVVKEKVVLSKFDNSSGNALGYSKNLDPAPYGSFYAPRNSSPEYWSAAIGDNQKDAPLYVYNGGSDAFPSAGVPWSVPSDKGSERICISSENTNFIGKPCLSSADCGASGLCGGFGSYCYKNDTHVMNGQACYATPECPNGYTCQLPPDLPATKAGAIQKLQSLFTKVYGIWEWNGSQYVACNGRDNCNYGNGDYLSFSYDSSPYNGTAPQVSHVAVTSTSTLAAPGGKVELHFNVDGSADQLPLEGIWINWNDGNTDFFKGPFNYKPYSNSDPNFDLNNSFKAYHVYTCYTNDRGDECVACGGDIIPNGNGECNYGRPKVNVKDHWGWCAAPANNSGWVDEASCVPGEGVSAIHDIIIQ